MHTHTRARTQQRHLYTPSKLARTLLLHNNHGCTVLVLSLCPLSSSPHSPLNYLGHNHICTSCSEAYGEEGKSVARDLACGHVFCTGCIQSLNQRGMLVCPTCRKTSAVRSDVITLYCTQHPPTTRPVACPLSPAVWTKSARTAPTTSCGSVSPSSLLDRNRRPVDTICILI